MYRAKIDNQGIYRGIEEVESITNSDVEVPEDCSLMPGKYSWNKIHSRFDPLPKSRQSTAPDAPSFEAALYAVIKSMPIPPDDAVKWAEYYPTTLDGKS